VATYGRNATISGGWVLTRGGWTLVRCGWTLIHCGLVEINGWCLGTHVAGGQWRKQKVFRRQRVVVFARQNG